MNQRKIMMFVPGILTVPGDARDWNVRAVRWAHINTDYRADDIEYFSDAIILRPLRAANRAKKLACALLEYAAAGYSITMVAHSNGCGMVLDGLQEAQWPRVEALHLVCGACEADFSRNGLNNALFKNHLDRIFVYVAKKDWALRLARTWMGKILGYGTLGLHGATHVHADVAGRVDEIEWAGYGHSDCWKPENFDRTMDHFSILDRLKNKGII